MIFTDILGGFETLFNDQYAIWFVLLASFVGIIFGALPGLTAAAAIAMMLPILIAYNDEIGGLAGLAFLYVIGKSGRYGGSIAAILVQHARHRRVCRNDAGRLSDDAIWPCGKGA